MVWTTKPPLGTQLDWANPLNNGLVGFWVFNEGMGDKVNDLSGNANTGTLTNMAFPSTTTSGWNPGRLGPAIAFDGVNDYIDAGSRNSLNLISEFTLEAWVKKQSQLGYRILVAKGYWVYMLGYYVNDNFIVYVNNADSLSSAVGSAKNNEWQHIVWTHSAASDKVYINSILNVTGDLPDPASDPSSALTIGGDPASLYSFDGSIDEVRIWNRALSASEIMELYINPYGMFLELGCPEILCTLNVI